jgi:hypothetical protein
VATLLEEDTAMITHLEPHQVFVYGSNEAGIHGAGAAKQALQWGAKIGMDGLCGQTYGISTKDRHIKTLTLDKIKTHVREFLYEAEERPHLQFIVTRIGCGLAGYRDEQIATFFKDSPPNVILPTKWNEFLC